MPEITERKMDEPLRLIIKAANQKYEDLKIDCNHAWSVLDLKRFLHQEYSFKPEVKGQRLIYFGYQLKDSQLVREVVSPSDESPYIFHLVYWNNNQTPLTGSNGVSNESPSTNSSQSMNSTMNNHTTDNSDNSSNQTSATQQSSPQITGMPLMDHRLDYYRAYNLMMSDYYRDMSQRYAIAGLNGQSLHDEEAFFRHMISRPVPNFVVNPGNRVSSQLIIIRRRSVDEQPQRGFLPNLQNVAQNFERIFHGRDLVQDMFKIIKAVLMSSMIMVYSSSNRLLIVMVIGLLFYLHQFRRLHQQPLQQTPPPRPGQEEQQEQQQQQQQQNENNNNINNNSIHENNNNNQNIQANDINVNTQRTGNEQAVSESDLTQQRQSRFRFVAEVVSSIFTSLIPEPPNVNQ